MQFPKGVVRSDRHARAASRCMMNLAVTIAWKARSLFCLWSLGWSSYTRAGIWQIQTSRLKILNFVVNFSMYHGTNLMVWHHPHRGDTGFRVLKSVQYTCTSRYLNYTTVFYWIFPRVAEQLFAKIPHLWRIVLFFLLYNKFNLVLDVYYFITI